MSLFFRSLAASVSIVALTACNSGSSSGRDDDPTADIQQWTVSATASAGGNVSAPAQRIDNGQIASLTVTANSGYRLVDVTGCGGSLDGTTYTTAPVIADCAIAANFEVIPNIVYTVSTTANAGGSFSATTQSVAAGGTATFTLTPDVGFGIDTVTGCDGTLNGNAYTTGVVAADCTVTATFGVRYTITGSSNVGGIIDPASQVVGAGATPSFMVIPDANYILDNVTGCGGTLNGLTYTTGPAAADCTFNANFIALHTITINSGPNGSVTPDTSETLLHGDALEITVLPAAGYVIDSINGCGIAKVGIYYWETATVTADCTINIAFRPLESIYAGGSHTCALYDDQGNSTDKCWGQNSKGQLGSSTLNLVAYLDQPANLPSFDVISGLSTVSMSLGNQHSCAILTNGRLYCWGDNQNGQLGIGTNIDTKAMDLPIDFSGKNVAQVAAGGQFTCVRLQNNEVYCWGDNSRGQLGDSDGGSDSTTPAQVNLGGATVTDLAAGGYHSCAIANSQIKCWGENGSGQLGNNDGTNTDLDVPSAALNIGGQIPLKLALGGEHSCVLTTIGTVYCWGESDAGQTGQHDTTDDIAPVQVNFDAGYTVQDLAAGGDHTCAVLMPNNSLDTTRPVRCWGEGGVGQLGLGNTDDIGDNENITTVPFINF